MEHVSKALSTLSTKGPPEQRRRSSSETELVVISATISRLLAHYWTANDSPGSRQAQLEDWIDDLREFRAAAVADACREWRRTQSRRPVPSDIRKLCVEARAERSEMLRLKAPDDMDAYARDLGFASNAERLEAIARDERRKADAVARLAASTHNQEHP